MTWRLECMSMRKAGMDWNGNQSLTRSIDRSNLTLSVWRKNHCYSLCLERSSTGRLCMCGMAKKKTTLDVCQSKSIAPQNKPR
mmetsp:Transcript_23545/g.44779  ORF Transcript_23545/g.44779 Transcript_23545/m.44779 type:complete len:83 (-) Transcript_23545:49-297(-)